MQLTEDIIFNRSKQSKLLAVKELNLCGFSLSKIAPIGKLTNVEVLALSVNNIRSLAPIANCVKLRELYLRRNEIEDLNELFHLQRLPWLTHLWLIENPFCDQLGYNYRAAVLSILPHIKVLDNVAVSLEEVEQAKQLDKVLCSCSEESQPELEPPEAKEDNEKSNQSNVLSAIFTLVKDLDLKGLEALHHSIEHRIYQKYSERE